MAEDRYLGRSQSYLMKTKEAGETMAGLRGFMPPLQKLREDIGQFEEVQKSVLNMKLDARHKYSSSFRSHLSY